MDQKKFESMLAQIEARTKEILSSPEKSRESLVKAGITDEDGNVTPTFKTPEGAIAACTNFTRR